MNMPWTMEQRWAVAELLKIGQSASEIGAVMGCSRNSVIGIVHRDPKLRAIGFVRSRTKTGGKRPAKPGKSRPKPVPSVKPTASPVRARAERIAAVIIRDDKAVPIFIEPVTDAEQIHTVGISLMMLTKHTCKWPINSPERKAPYLFCGVPTDTGPYCPHHADRATANSGTRTENDMVRDTDKAWGADAPAGMGSGGNEWF